LYKKKNTLHIYRLENNVIHKDIKIATFNFFSF